MPAAHTSRTSHMCADVMEERSSQLSITPASHLTRARGKGSSRIPTAAAATRWNETRRHDAALSLLCCAHRECDVCSWKMCPSLSPLHPPPSPPPPAPCSGAAMQGARKCWLAWVHACKTRKAYHQAPSGSLKASTGNPAR